MLSLSTPGAVLASSLDHSTEENYTKQNELIHFPEYPEEITYIVATRIIVSRLLSLDELLLPLLPGSGAGAATAVGTDSRTLVFPTMSSISIVSSVFGANVPELRPLPAPCLELSPTTMASSDA
jgi:hypothetical protein